MLPATADQCVYNTIKDCLAGDYVETQKDTSYEVLHYQTGMTNPRARIVTNPYRPLNLTAAIARFVWLIGGNNRVEDIAFYEPKVRRFTDDGLTVPGSDYGMRLMTPRPGLNQIQGVIDRLRANPYTRQAAAVVWQPEDAVRESSDIPCTFGLLFHYRDETGLQMCTTMRSNNAFRILPFNLFEFSMLHEIVATECDMPLGNYVHWAASMHVYDNQMEIGPTRGFVSGACAESTEMPSMPKGYALGGALALARHEAALRHAPTTEEFDGAIMDAAEELGDYWWDLFEILVIWHRQRRGLPYGQPQQQ